MRFEIRHASEQRKSFGDYRYDIYENGRKRPFSLLEAYLEQNSDEMLT